MVEKKHFRRSWIFYILSGVLLIAGLLVWRNFKYRLANKKIDQLVDVKSKGLYHIDYKNLKIDEVLGQLSADSIRMQPDTVFFNSLKKDNKEPSELFDIRVARLSVTGVKTPKALLQKEISAHLLKIDDAQVEIRVRKETEKSDSSGKSEKNKEGKSESYKKNLGLDFYKQLFSHLNSVQVDSILVKNASLILREEGTNTVLFSATGIDLGFENVLIDSAHQNDSTQLLFSENLEWSCRLFKLGRMGKPYDMKFSNIRFSSRSGTFQMEDVTLTPRLSETAFASHFRYATDRYNLHVKKISLTNIQRKALFRQEIDARLMRIEHADLRIYRDITHHLDSAKGEKKYPQTALRQMDIPVNIDRIEMQGCYVEYKEKNPRSDTSGTVRFQQVRASLDHVSNMENKIREHPQMTLDFHSLFLGKATFIARMKMDMRNPNHFQLDAALGSMEARSLNDMVKPMALVEIKKGKVTGLDYHLDGTRTHGTGKLQLTYEDLSLKVLKRDSSSNQYKTRFLPTLASSLIIQPSNPRDGKTRTADVDYARDMYRSIFNFMWKSMFSGVKQIVK